LTAPPDPADSTRAIQLGQVEACVVCVTRRLVVASSGLCVLLSAAVLAKGDADPVRYLAANCSNCHGTTGSSESAIPNLAGLQKPYFVEQMKLFREGKRPATLMQQIAKGYTDQQIEALADYYARLSPQ
jgi:cytochrome c553